MSNKLICAFLILIVISCTTPVKIFDYQVSEICQMSPRKVEALNEFGIKGVVADNINFGFINAFSIADSQNQNMRIFVISENNTSPGLAGNVVSLKLRLYKEISFGGETVILFKEMAAK
jgi:hypothetical protein